MQASSLMFFKSAKTKRITHLTFHKCGSQWVRDVLTAPEVSACTHFENANLSPSLNYEDWPEQKDYTVMGPVYNARPSDWLAQRKSGDKAILVTRDPRDRMVSYVFSVANSHFGNLVLREPLRALTTRQKIQFGIYDFFWISGIYKSWASFPTNPHIFRTSYEKIIQDEEREFRAMFDFLNWNLPDVSIKSAINRLSFKSRSGRERGQTDLHSHYRKGEAGDWKNYFDRELGLEFEKLFPGLLVYCGYESSNTWHESLPENKATPEDESSRLERESADMKAELTRLKETCNQLTQRLGEKQGKTDAFLRGH